MTRPPRDFSEEWRQQRKEDDLRAELDEMRHQLSKLTKPGRPGPNWDAYEGIGRLMREHGISLVEVRVALFKLIMRTEAVKKATVEDHIRKMSLG
jgi:hypothetical protein